MSDEIKEKIKEEKKQLISNLDFTIMDIVYLRDKLKDTEIQLNSNNFEILLSLNAVVDLFEREIDVMITKETYLNEQTRDDIK